MEGILEKGGYASVRSVLDSREAVQAAVDFKPDLILLDLMMPHLDGFAVMDQLKPLVEAQGCLPILVLTADSNPDSKRRALKSGARDFLTKPLDAIEVLLRIENMLETRFLFLKQQRHAAERIQDQATLIDQANDAILVHDLNDSITFWNEGARRLFEWTAEEALGQTSTQLLSSAPPSALLRAEQEVMENGNWSGELTHVTKSGKQVITASRWTLIHDEQGRPKSRLIINTDITEKKHLEASLLHAQKMEAFGQLAGGIAHDFNNLLTVIIGFSEVLLSERVPAEKQGEHILEIRKAGDRAAALTRQLLAFSRKQLLQPTELNLNAVVADIEKMLGRLIGEDIDLATSLDPALGSVKADPGQIEQVIINLIVNARDAMPRGGHITVETRNVELDPAYARTHAEIQPGHFVLLAVTDSGCGMDDRTRSRVFEPFFTTKGAGRGTGLGLATVYGIIKQSGGSIEVYSEIDHGTTFKIYLPRLDGGARVSRSAPGAEHTPGGTETILLAEDQDEVRAIARMALESSGYKVLAASCGDDAVELCRNYPGPIHLLLTDVVMPRMSGRQLVELVVAMRPEIEVLYLSGYTDDAVVRHGVLEAGIAFLHKPFTPLVLTRKVREVLDDRQE